jgi:hypothetical protein
VNEVVKKRGAEFDLVYITRHSVAERLWDSIRLHAPQAKILFNNADLHFLKELRASIAACSKDGVSHAEKTREAELAVMRKVDLVLFYKEMEHAYTESEFGLAGEGKLMPVALEAVEVFAAPDPNRLVYDTRAA